MSEIPKEGVKKMVESSDGRKYLAELQEKHKLDILQPSDPMFEKVYGERIKIREESLRKKEESAKSEWKENAERREYEKFRKEHTNKKYL